MISLPIQSALSGRRHALSWLIAMVPLALMAVPASAQDLVDQERVGTILESNAEALDRIPEVYYYEYYVFGTRTDNTESTKNRGDGR